MQLAERLRRVLALGGDGWALECEGEQYSWAQLGGLADAIGTAIRDAGAKPHDVVGWSAENTAGSVATLVSLLLAEHCAATINPHMAPKILSQELREQLFPIIVGGAHFWNIAGMVESARESGSAGLLVTFDGTGGSVTPVPGLERVGPGRHRDPMPGTVIERLSSGTTGPPKRSPQSEQAILNALILGERKEGPGKEEFKIKTSPSIIFRALAHSGSFATMLALFSGRPISLQDKFSIEYTMDAVRRHRPKVISLVPTMIKMVWDANVPKGDVSSLIAMRSGTAPLDPKLQESFEDKYGIPILIDYGATEFGGVASWTMKDHAQFAKAKRGSVGRAVPGAQLRIVDQENGREITDGGIGILEVKAEKTDNDWISTTDLATIDEDGFLFIKGRADDAIIRGGFKVLPDDVVKAMRQHPDIKDVAVVGVPDERLGAVPVAVIELQPGAPAPDEAAFKQFAREHLTAYQVPVAYKFIDKLPRSVSMKVIKSEVLEFAKA